MRLIWIIDFSVTHVSKLRAEQTILLTIQCSRGDKRNVDVVIIIAIIPVMYTEVAERTSLFVLWNH